MTLSGPNSINANNSYSVDNAYQKVFGSNSQQLETIIYQKSSLASLELLIYDIVNGQMVDNLLLHGIIRTKALGWLQVICLVPKPCLA